jgi:hypothetical protein
MGSELGRTQASPLTRSRGAVAARVPLAASLGHPVHQREEPNDEYRTEDSNIVTGHRPFLRARNIMNAISTTDPAKPTTAKAADR